jgi:hypothetical protein
MSVSQYTYGNIFFLVFEQIDGNKFSEERERSVRFSYLVSVPFAYHDGIWKLMRLLTLSCM